jgi:hypothetical protein
MFFCVKRGSTHLTPHHTATTDIPQGCTWLLSAHAKCQNIHSINKSNERDIVVRGVTKINPVSIIEDKKNGRKSQSLSNTSKILKQYRKKTRKTEEGRTFRKK